MTNDKIILAMHHLKLAVEAIESMESIKPTTVKRQPKPGDRYTLGTMSVLVESVELDAVRGDRVHYLLGGVKRSELIVEFEKLAAKSIANGAVFHPANAYGSDVNEGKAKL